ncbi:MAG: hypothetical protein RL630_1511 [Verrucomicrobiota bacterium]
MEGIFENRHAVVLESLEFGGSSFPGDDFDEFMGRLAVEDRADHEPRRQLIPHQLAGAVGAFGEFLGRNIKQDAATLDPPI